jgi:predicted dehydrogenase
MSPTLEPVRIGLIGTGAIAQVAHLPILTRMRGVDMVALCDADLNKARTIAGRFGVERVHTSIDDMLDDQDVQAVVVCTPSDLHEEQVRTALRAGKYVLCEKPLALTAAGAERILKTKGAASRLMVGMNQRFRPDAQALRSFVAGGDLGEIFYLRAGWLNRRGGRGPRSWRQQKSAAGGGAFMDLGIQMLDLALWLMDYPEPDRLVAHVHRAAPDEVEDSAVLLLRLADGRLINLEVTWALASERERQYLHILGSSGSGSLTPLKVYKDLDSGLADVTPVVAPGRENPFTASYRQQLAYFAELVRGRVETSRPSEQVALLRLVEAVYRSADKSKEITL